MPDWWVIRFHPEAIGDLYAIPRGIAGLVTDTIESLRDNPRPESATDTERPDLYRIESSGYLVDYQISDEMKEVTVLAISSLSV